MKSDAKTVDAYIATRERDRKKAITKLRELMNNLIPNAEETMKYKMPTYNNEEQIFAFSSQKHYISLYIYDNELIFKYKQELGKVDLGKHCIRFRKLEDMKFDVIEKLLKEAVVPK